MLAEMHTEAAHRFSHAAPGSFDFLESLERYCVFFTGKSEERASFARLALSMRRVEMAAIAAAAELRLSPGPEADAFANKVVDLALANADEAFSNGDTAIEVASLRAADFAARGRSEAATKLDGRLNERLIEEIERDPLELEVIGKLIGIGSVPASTLTEIFRKADALGAYAVASLAAEAAVDAGKAGKLDRELLTQLRSQSRQFLAARNTLAAASYFLPLFRMAPEVESVSVLRPRVVRLVSDALRKADVSATDSAKLLECLERLDAANPVLLRWQALAAARRADAHDARERLEVLAAALPSCWRDILAEARSAFDAGDMRYALILYGWLASRGYATSEAEKTRVRGLRARVSVLRDSAKGNDAEAMKAASDVLEVDPENARALWIKSRALFRLRRADEAIATLRRLVQVSPDYPGARDLLHRQEKQASARGGA